MISIIICSINPERLKAVSHNISQTIGVEHEIIAIDNKVEQLSICAAYNKGAEQAQYPYMCFAHEDILFHTDGWGHTIIEKLQEIDCGVIGFAGSLLKTRALTGWSINRALSRVCFTENVPSGRDVQVYNPYDEKYSEVVTLDGLCLFVRGDVWAKVRFDSDTFQGFHLYDLDFTTAVKVAGYRNYTCYNIDIEHLSAGNFDHKWHSAAEIYTEKWKDMLPIYVGEYTDRELKMLETRMYNGITYQMIKRRVVSRQKGWEMVKSCFRAENFTINAFDIYLRFQREKSKMMNN